jgi:SAM-dependent methyltransferase
MTVWDKIYKQHQPDPKAWDALGKDLHPFFVEFVKSTDFRSKVALDIGCGTGHYLKYLQSLGFTVDGIDSSETAVHETQKWLGPKSRILCEPMYEWPIPQGRYDLILSIKTLHHGAKNQVENLIGRIHAALLPGGWAFITLPDISRATKWKTFKDSEQIAPGTYIPQTGPEKGLPHSFFSKTEVKKLFSHFKSIHLDLDDRFQWVVRAEK